MPEKKEKGKSVLEERKRKGHKCKNEQGGMTISALVENGEHYAKRTTVAVTRKSGERALHPWTVNYRVLEKLSISCFGFFGSDVS